MADKKVTDMTVKELDALAEEKGIDISECGVKAEKLAAIVAVLGEDAEAPSSTPPRKSKTTQPTEAAAVMVNGVDPKTGKKKVREIKTKKVISVWPIDANELIQSGHYEAVE